MACENFDLSSQPLPLWLLRVRQLREHDAEPLLRESFRAVLDHPMMSVGERTASTERLLFARRRG